MTKPDIAAVAILAGRELDVHLFEWMFHPNCPDWLRGCHGPALHYSRDRDPSLFDVLERMEKVVLRKHKDKPAWYTAIVIANGVCKEADGDNLNEALARAALLTAYPPKEATDAR